jgi:PAS domain S-box-containing protein
VEGMAPLAEERSVVLRRRLEASAVIAFVSVGLFTGVDWSWGTLPPLLVVVRLAQAVLAAATWLFARRARSWDAVANGSLVFVLLLTLTAVCTAILRGETQSVPVLVTMIVVITATFTSWGLRRQLVLCVLAFAGLLANLAALAELETALPYPLLPITVALGVSAWVAAESDRRARDRNRSERALRESEERFRTLAEHAPVPIWMSDADGSFTYLNPAWNGLVAPGASATRSFWRAVHPKDREHLLAEARLALTEGRPYETETRLVTPDGRTRWIAVCGVPRFGPIGAYEGHVGTATDVTERKAEANDLAAAHSAAVEAGRLKSSFLATMSHEIRTPMHGIFGMTELALDTRDDAERTEFIRRARSCAKTLMTLLDEILDLSRIEAGKLDLVHEAVDLDEVIQNAVDTVAMAATENGLEMNVEIAPDVPTTIGGDANRLRQILTNLLANALKFTEVGEVDLRVQLRDGALVLSVRDTGIGIPPEACDRIFEPFTQADRTVTQRFGGTGLGLAISKRLATGMGGDIAVESILGVGTTFTVTLPLRAPLGPPHGARFRELQGLSVLLAHGRPARRGQLRGLLEAYGCRLRCVATAAEAEREVRDAARGDDGPDVVLADVDLGTPDAPVATRLRAAAGRKGLEIILICPLKPHVRDGRGDCFVVTQPLVPAPLLRTLLEARGSLAATGS